MNQIREIINQKPIISVGLANVKDLPLSKIKVSELRKTINVSHGYPSFLLVIRNTGKVSAKSAKIHVEYLGPNKKSLYMPVIEMDDWLGDERHLQESE